MGKLKLEDIVREDKGVIIVNWDNFLEIEEARDEKDNFVYPKECGDEYRCDKEDVEEVRKIVGYLQEKKILVRLIPESEYSTVLNSLKDGHFYFYGDHGRFISPNFAFAREEDIISYTQARFDYFKKIGGKGMCYEIHKLIKKIKE